jgi:GntR family transcriptional regulator
MIVNIQPDSPVPIYEQIVTQITYAIAAGDVKPGAEVPSVRELAQRLVVNPNTVFKAYQELERRRVLTSQRGKPMVVTAEAPSLCRGQRRDLVREHIRTALREAVSSGLTPDEVRHIVDEELARARGHQDQFKVKR